MKDNSHKRHIAKAVTWRIIGTLDTMLLAWLITGNAMTGLKIGAVELATKMILYYLHERAWYKLNLTKDGKKIESKKRHLMKTVTWRVIGSIDTFVLGWVISGNPFAGFKISLAEVLTKMILYYLHERAWYRVSYGLERRYRMRNIRKIKSARVKKENIKKADVVKQ